MGANPINTEIGIGEEIECIRRERNSFVHRVNANISESLFDDFFVTFIEVGKRIDAYLNKSTDIGYAHAVEQYKTCVLDPDTEKKLLDARADIEQLKEKYRFDIGYPGKEIHIFVGKSTAEAIEKIRAEEDLLERYTEFKIIVHEVDDSEEVVRHIISRKEDLNSENINFKGVEKGSIILFIDVKNRVVLDDVMFQSEVGSFIQKLFKFCNIACYIHTQPYAVIASSAEEFEDPTVNLPEEARGTCLMGDKGHVVVNFEIKNKIFHSPDSLERTLQEVFNILVLKGNGQNLLGETHVYSELVKSENLTEDAFTQAQIPVKYNLPVSVALRQQFNMEMSRYANQTVTSCIKIGNTLVFTDYDHRRLIICNADSSYMHYIPLSYRPYYITGVNSTTVAVSCFNSTIVIIDLSTGSATSTIDIGYLSYGISYHNNNLYVVIDKSTIHVMDLTGNVVHIIPVPSERIRDITVDRNSLVYIDDTSIYWCSLDGNQVVKFENKKYHSLRRVTKDYEGNVYVTNNQTNTVIVVSDDGKQYREILTESDGLNRPFGIYFDKKENILLVCNETNGNIFLFDVKR